MCLDILVELLRLVVSKTSTLLLGKKESVTKRNLLLYCSFFIKTI